MTAREIKKQRSGKLYLAQLRGMDQEYPMIIYNHVSKTSFNDTIYWKYFVNGVGHNFLSSHFVFNKLKN